VRGLMRELKWRMPGPRMSLLLLSLRFGATALPRLGFIVLLTPYLEAAYALGPCVGQN